jgi:hypothetical protein
MEIAAGDLFEIYRVFAFALGLIAGALLGDL